MENRSFIVTVELNNGHGTSCSVGFQTLQDAFSGAIKESSYYAIECGYRPTFSIREECQTCYGDGQVCRHTGKTKRSKTRLVRCPNCKGKDTTRTVVENVPFVIHSNCGAKFNGKLSHITSDAIDVN